MQGIVPCLWFDDNAEEAVRFYVSLFREAKLLNVARYSESGSQAAGRPEGSAMAIRFQLQGQEFLALNGGPVFTFSPAVSFIANCDTQEELDELWGKLSDGGATERCGWLRDRYGVSRQVVPALLGSLMQDPDTGRSSRVMKALLQMGKIDIGALQRAYEGG
jgi:predicted 3-demethylubiquinone-9 3-methyltransferase (glyoxalase superfamily)